METRRIPVETRLPASDGMVGVSDWPAEGPALLFVHATGFHRRCWDEVIRLLPGYRCIALDLMGHGLSDKPEPPGPYGWDRLARTIAEVVPQLGTSFRTGVGHSIGGYMVSRVAAALPAAFENLLLVNPSILARPAYGPPRDSAATSYVAKRRDKWASPEEMFARFVSGPPFGDWRPEVLRAYCEHGLAPAPGGDGYVLACPPAVEASVYAQTATSDPYDDIAALALPGRIIRAKQREGPGPFDMSYSPTTPGLAAAFRNVEDFLFPGESHYMPMESPELVARHVLEVAGGTDA